MAEENPPQLSIEPVSKPLDLMSVERLRMCIALLTPADPS